MADTLAVELPDYSEYLNEERFRHEEEEWARQKFYERNAQAVMEMKPQTLLEIGCGSGWIPWELERQGFGCAYVGMDANLYCLQAAHIKNPGKMFVFDDIRTLPKPGFQTVCAFAVLKHFGLSEWDDIFIRFLSCAPSSVFTMQIVHDGLDSMDDGEEYPHSWVTWERITSLARRAGHEIIKVDPGIPAKHGSEKLIWTKVPSKQIYVPTSGMPS